MPVRPPPLSYVCRACGWSKIVAPKSDALVSGGYFSTCPKCGNAAITAQPANTVSASLAKWLCRNSA